MLWTIFVILLVLYILGLVSSYTLGGFIHLLLILALSFDLKPGFRTTRGHLSRTRAILNELLRAASWNAFVASMRRDLCLDHSKAVWQFLQCVRRRAFSVAHAAHLTYIALAKK